MLLTLILAGIEHGINHIITHREMTQSRLTPLIHKTLQITLLKPHLQMIVIFGEYGVRFEPVLDEIFEPQGGFIQHRPDGHLTLADIDDVLDFIKLPFDEHSVIYTGDKQVLTDLYHFIQTFDIYEFIKIIDDKWDNLPHDLYPFIRPILHHLHITRPH